MKGWIKRFWDRCKPGERDFTGIVILNSDKIPAQSQEVKDYCEKVKAELIKDREKRIAYMLGNWPPKEKGPE